MVSAGQLEWYLNDITYLKRQYEKSCSLELAKLKVKNLAMEREISFQQERIVDLEYQLWFANVNMKWYKFWADPILSDAKQSRASQMVNIAVDLTRVKDVTIDLENPESHVFSA